MKNKITIGILLALLVINVSCSSNTPEKVTLAFFNHLFDGDFEEAKKYATTNTKSLITMMGSFGVGDQFEDDFKGAKFKVLETTYEEDDKATCKLQIKTDDDIDTQDVHLIKKEGKWLVNMGKEDGGLNKENKNKEIRIRIILIPNVKSQSKNWIADRAWPVAFLSY